MPGASEVKAGGAFVEITGETRPLDKALKTAAKSMKSFVSGIASAVRTVVKAGAKMARAMSAVGGAILRAGRALAGFISTQVKRGLVAFAAGMGLAVKEAISFESAMAKANTIMSLARDELSEMSSDLLALAGKAAKSPKELAGALFQVTSAGVDAKDAMKVLKVATKAATAGMTSTFTAVDVLTTLLNAYGVSTDKAGLASDILFQTAKQGKTTFEEMAGTIGRVAPIAASAGVSLNELGAMIATLTKGGLSTDEAMTGIRASILSVLTPSTEATEVIKAINAELKKLGKKEIKFGLEGLRDVGFVKTLQNLAAAVKTTKFEGGDLTRVLLKLFNNIRALTPMMALSGKQAKELAKQMKIMGKVSGSSDEALKLMAATVSHQLKQAWEGLRAQAIALGTEFLPMVVSSFQNLVKWVGIATAWLTENADTIKAFYAEALFIVSDVLEGIKSSTGSVLAAIQGNHDTVWDAIQAKVLDTFMAIRKVWETAHSVLGPIISSLGDALKGDWEAAGKKWETAILSTASAIFDVLDAALPVMLEIGATMLESIIDGLRDAKVLARAADLIALLWDTLMSTSMVQRLKELGVEMGKAIASGIYEATIGALADKALELAKKIPVIGGLSGGIGMLASPTAGGISDVNAQLPDPSVVGTGAGGNITINNNFKQDNSDIERLSRDTKRLQRRGRL